MTVNLRWQQELEDVLESLGLGKVQEEMTEEEQKTREEEARRRFKITDKGQLSWALRQKAALQAKKQEIEEYAKQEIQRVKDWMEQEMETLNRSEEFFDGLIQEYAMNRRLEDPTFKSEKTPYGTIQYKKQQPEWKYDNDKLIQYLQQKGRTDLIRIKPEPNKTAIKKSFEIVGNQVVDPQTGEVIEGITIEHRDDKLVINPNN